MAKKGLSSSGWPVRKSLMRGAMNNKFAKRVKGFVQKIEDLQKKKDKEDK